MIGAILIAMLLVLHPAISRAQQDRDLHSGAFLLSDADLLRDSPDTFSRRQAQEDFSALEEVLANAYGGYDVFQARGGNWKELFKKDRQRLEEKNEWRLTSFFGLVTELFRDAGVIDGHLFVTAHSPTTSLWAAPGLLPWGAFFSDFYVKKSQDNFYLISRSSPTDSEELVSVEGQSPETYLFPTFVPGMPSPLFLLGSFGVKPAHELHCVVKKEKSGTRVIVLHPELTNTQRSIDAQLPFERKTVSGIPVIVLRSLQMSNQQRENFYREAERIRTEPTIILDARGLSEGDSRTGIRWLQLLTNETIHSRFRQESLQSSISYAGELNRWKRYLQQHWDAGSLRNIEEHNQESLKGFREAEGLPPVKKWVEQPHEYPGMASANFSGTLILLSDSGNREQGEIFIGIGKSFPHTVIIGENTAGLNAFYPTSPYRLPNSRIEISFGSSFNHDGDMIEEARGVVPDIWIDETDILSAAISYAQAVRNRHPAR